MTRWNGSHSQLSSFICNQLIVVVTLHWHVVVSGIRKLLSFHPKAHSLQKALLNCLLPRCGQFWSSCDFSFTS
jgi:hypothetical protein